jgi:hypothetical protein
MNRRFSLVSSVKTASTVSYGVSINAVSTRGPPASEAGTVWRSETLSAGRWSA